MLKLQAALILTISVLISCTGKNESGKNDLIPDEKKYYDGKGVGPVTEMKLDSINKSLAETGEKVFQSKCISCHKNTEERMIGPGLSGISKRRRPEWIMNQILNPLGMTQEDSLSKQLLNIYLTQMTPMDVTMEEARSLLEYFRLNDSPQ